MQTTSLADGRAHGNWTVSVKQAQEIMGSSLGMGVVNGALEARKHYKKISQAQQAQQPRIVEIDVETGQELQTFNNHNDSNSESSESSHRSNSPLIERSMFTERSNQPSMSSSCANQLTTKLLQNHEREENQHESSSNSSGDYSPPHLPASGAA